MLYVIAMVGENSVRIYNTEVKESKDITIETLAQIKGMGVEVRNTSPLKEDGSFNILGGRKNYPMFIKEGNEKKLVTPNILTVVEHTSAGKTVVVDAFGKETIRFTRSLYGIKMSNAAFTPDYRLEGYFETIDYESYLASYAESISLFGGIEETENYTFDNGMWGYKGPKKVDKIVVPNGVTSLSVGSLNGVTVGSLELPSTLQELKRGQLQGLFAQNIHIPVGKLQTIDNQAFFDVKVRNLYLFGQTNIHPLAFYGSRIVRIYAQGNTYKACISAKPSLTTQVKPFKA